MRHIKSYKLFESIDMNLGTKTRFETRFGISQEEINDLLIDVKDDFTDIDYWIGSAEDSWIVEVSPVMGDDDKIFVIYFESIPFNWEKENLYDLEHFLLKGKLNHIKSYLKDYGLEIYAADFGEVDTQYEIVVCKKGTPIIKTEEYRKRYLQDKHSEKKG